MDHYIIGVMILSELTQEMNLVSVFAFFTFCKGCLYVLLRKQHVGCLCPS